MHYEYEKLVGLMTLSVSVGDAVLLTAEGDDAEDVLVALERLL